MATGEGHPVKHARADCGGDQIVTAMRCNGLHAIRLADRATDNTGRKYEPFPLTGKARRALHCIPMQGNAIPDVGDTPVERDLYPIPEAATRLGISARKTWDLVKSGELATVWIDGRRLVPATVLAAYVRKLTEAAA